VGAVVTLVWVVRFLAMSSVLAGRCVLRDAHDPESPTLTPTRALDGKGGTPRVSVVVAAKDEEANIEACLTSVLVQDYPHLQVIAVDDRSTDRTPAILAELALRFPDRLQVLTVHQIAEGWFGKCNAMRTGVAAATGGWLLFSDADCQFSSRGTIRLAINEALADNVDFLTMSPQLESPTLWERIVQPVCVLILMSWFRPDRVNDPAKRTAYANGAFMLMRRECYDAIGGHAAVRTQLNEDIVMARLAKATGRRLRVVGNDGLLSSRMYPCFVDGFRGWSRIFCGSLSAPLRVVAALLLVLLFSIAPWVTLVGLVLATPFAASAAWTWALLAWSAAVIAQQACLWRVYGLLTVGRRWSLTFIIGAVVAALMLVNALLKCLGATKTTWRSTTYRGNRTVGAFSEGITAPPAKEPIPEAPLDVVNLRVRSEPRP
jgi:chlorobactene glucosyltransferase